MSVFDILKIGVGPSSSHTLGPWRAAERFLHELGDLRSVAQVQVGLYGSLALTGKGHGTDVAVIMGLRGFDPVTVPVDDIFPELDRIRKSSQLNLGGQSEINFDPERDVVFHHDQCLLGHPNGLLFTAQRASGESHQAAYYSVGGGFVVAQGEQPTGSRAVRLPYPIDHARQIEAYCAELGVSIPGLVRRNEDTWRPRDETELGVRNIYEAMRDCCWRGCHTGGTLPGGLNVKRRAAELHQQLMSKEADSPATWIKAIQQQNTNFSDTLQWVSCFALAVNEENANFGRVVTAPTNGAAGVIPAVLLHWVCHHRGDDESIQDFLLTASEIGSLFKKGATISAAMGGCQAEIGVSSAMAAAGLCQVMGGSVGQVLMAAEIAMEHHLGLTCDPIAGLVQIPCIERNSMGAVKAITAAQMALTSDPASAKVHLDHVILTMWNTALDMNTKYKETAEGGLALQISVAVPEC
ncbi:MAG: L-serine ammonia-lyase [Chthonomonas sp.]|nr:L-serine ammonia-lyase [Chthonomonas sp.]